MLRGEVTAKRGGGEGEKKRRKEGGTQRGSNDRKRGRTITQNRERGRGKRELTHNEGEGSE